MQHFGGNRSWVARVILSKTVSQMELLPLVMCPPGCVAEESWILWILYVWEAQAMKKFLT